METKNIMIVGVGGQGTLLTSRILGGIILESGYDVKLSEVHGMAQRGGSVTTFVRYGDKVFEPIVEEGCADILIAFEKLEALRYAHFLKKEGILIDVYKRQLEVLPEGSEGELVITCLTKETIPLLRYRTRDITSLNYEKCRCGRTTVRMEPLKGRSDDMLLIRGVNVFPSQIEEVLLGIDEIGANYEIEVNRDKHMDNMLVRVELTDYDLLDSFSLLEQLEKRIKFGIREIVGIDATIKILAPRSLKRFEGKAKRVLDLRDKN